MDLAFRYAHDMIEFEPTVVLSNEQIDTYHENGFLVVEQISTPCEIAWMREVYDRLFASRAGREVGDQFDLAGTDEEGNEATLPQILGPSNYAPELKSGLYRTNILSIAKQLLGDQAEWGGDHAIFKPALIGAETPWHQDEAYWDPEWQYNSFSAWMPLQEATIENGCMWFIPGSHRVPIQPHHSINHDPRIHGLEMDQVDTSKAVACPLAAGGCTFHHNATMHYTGPNRSGIDRRAFIVGAGGPATKRIDSRDFYWNRMKQTAREARRREKLGS